VLPSKYRDNQNAIVAPIVAAKITRMLPSTSPKIAPASRDKILAPGKEKLVAKT